MSVYVLVLKNGQAIAREGYSGDTTGVQARLDARKAKDPTLDFLIFQNESDPDYANAQIVSPLTPSQQAWDTFKKTNPSVPQMILYLARAMGLEP